MSGSSHPEGKNPWTAANTFPKHKIPIKCKHEIRNSESLVVGTGIVNTEWKTVLNIIGLQNSSQESVYEMSDACTTA